VNLINPLSSISASGIRPTDLTPPAGKSLRGIEAPSVAPSGESFPSAFERMIGGVEADQAKAAGVTRDVLMGNNPNIHQSMIAMQEASLSFSLMVEVRNKVVESYQELMRMPV
tara:strand:- start:101 stop:439 length:339 start_codon:yes stop_codon:yes gene_type:complete